MVPHSNWWSLIKLRCRRLPELHYYFFIIFFFYKNENNFAKSTSNHEGADQKGRGNFLNNNLQNNWNVIFFHLIKYSKQRRIKKKKREKTKRWRVREAERKKKQKTSKLFYFDVKIIGHSRLCERERSSLCGGLSDRLRNYDGFMRMHNRNWTVPVNMGDVVRRVVVWWSRHSPLWNSSA